MSVCLSHCPLLDGIRPAQLCVISPVWLPVDGDTPSADIVTVYAFEAEDLGSIMAVAV